MKKILLLFTALTAFTASAVQAQMIVDFTNFYQLDSDGPSVSQLARDAEGDVGIFNNNSNVVWTFELPDLGGNPLTAADISLAFRRDTGLSGSGGTALGSLFVANSLRASDSVTTADLIDPADPLSPSGWTLIQDDFVTTSTSSNQNVSLSGTGQTNLLSFLDSNYNAGEFVVFSVAMDLNGEDPADHSAGRFEFDTDRPTAGHYQLSLTQIPEPSSFVLVAGMIGGFLLFRRRRA